MELAAKPEIYKNDTYQVVITKHPDGLWFEVYGIQNRQTGVYESFATQLAVAIDAADALQDALRQGSTPKQTDQEAEAALIRAMSAQRRKETEGTGGSGNLQ